MLLLADIKNIRGHYARQKLYVYNQSLVPIRTFRPTTWLSDRRNINACDSRDRCEERYYRCWECYREDPHQVDIHGGSKCREKFPEEHKIFCF